MINSLAFLDHDLLNDPGLGGMNGIFHFHGIQHTKGITRLVQAPGQ